MGDPSFGLSPSADAGTASQSPPPFLPGNRPFLQAPILGLPPSLAAFVFPSPMLPRVGAWGQPSLSLDTGGPSYQVSPPTVGQFPCPSTAAFAPASLVPLSSQFAPLPQVLSVTSHAGISPPPLAAPLHPSPTVSPFDPYFKSLVYPTPGPRVDECRYPILALPSW